MSRKKRLNLNFRPSEDSLIRKENSTGNDNLAWLPSDYSPTNLISPKEIEKEISSISFGYQLTVCPKVELTRYQCSMLLEVLSMKVINYGINFSLYLCLEYLNSRLLGSKQIMDLRNENERKVVYLSQILLRTIDGNWFNLGDLEKLPEQVVKDLRRISNLLPTEREFQSRSQYWDTCKFLKVQTVRLDTFLERREISERYSSYCKGYGESSSMGHRKKTRPSAELDGEDTDRPEVILNFSELQLLLDLVRLDIQAQESKKRKRR